MPGVIRDSVDTAGGVIGTPIQTFCKAEGYNMAILNEAVAPHGLHINAKMIQASAFCKINGIGACKAGDFASCGHTATPGSSVVFIGTGIPHVWDDTLIWADADIWADF